MADSFSPWIVAAVPETGQVWACCEAFTLVKEEGSWGPGGPSADDLKDNFERVGDDDNPSSEAVKLFQEAKAAFLSVPSLRKAMSKAS